MKDFGWIMALLVVGAWLVLFAKGILKARDDGDGFSFPYFIASNLNRIYLLVFGFIAVGLALFLDPAGLESVFEQLPVAVKIGSPLMIGAGFAGIVLILPTNKPKE